MRRWLVISICWSRRVQRWLNCSIVIATRYKQCSSNCIRRTKQRLRSTVRLSKSRWTFQTNLLPAMNRWFLYYIDSSVLCPVFRILFKCIIFDIVLATCFSAESCQWITAVKTFLLSGRLVEICRTAVCSNNNNNIRLMKIDKPQFKNREILKSSTGRLWKCEISSWHMLNFYWNL